MEHPGDVAEGHEVGGDTKPLTEMPPVLTTAEIAELSRIAFVAGHLTSIQADYIVRYCDEAAGLHEVMTWQAIDLPSALQTGVITKTMFDALRRSPSSDLPKRIMEIIKRHQITTSDPRNEILMATSGHWNQDASSTIWNACAHTSH